MYLRKLERLFFSFSVFGVSIQPSISSSNLKVGDSVEITATVNFNGNIFKTFKFLNGITPIAELNSAQPNNFIITTKGKELFGDRASVKVKGYTFTIRISNLTESDSMTISMEFLYGFKGNVTEKINIVVRGNFC